MGNKICPHCKKTFLKTTRTYRRCPDEECGYKERKGKCFQYKEKPQMVEKIITTVPGKKEKISVPKLTTRDIPELAEPKKKLLPSKMTDKEEDNISWKIEVAKKERRRLSVEKILKKLRKNKYSGLKGKKIDINGELYEV